MTKNCGCCDGVGVGNTLPRVLSYSLQPFPPLSVSSHRWSNWDHVVSLHAHIGGDVDSHRPVGMDGRISQVLPYVDQKEENLFLRPVMSPG